MNVVQPDLSLAGAVRVIRLQPSISARVVNNHAQPATFNIHEPILLHFSYWMEPLAATLGTLSLITNALS